jgi:hypothetical protein
LDRHNHIESLRELPLPERDHLKQDGLLHRLSRSLQDLLTIRDFTQPPTAQAVIDAILRLDAAVLTAYNLPASVQYKLLKLFSGWRRPLPPPYDTAFDRYFPDHFEEHVTLPELLAITADWAGTSKQN